MTAVTVTKQQVINKATEMFMSDQARKGFSGLAQTRPEVSELLQEGYLAKAKEHLETLAETRYALKQWEHYSESLNSKQLSSEKLKNNSTVLSNMIPFDLAESCDSGFYISGTTQSGKSTLAKHLVKRLVDNGIVVYVLDVSKVWPQNTPIQNVIEVSANSNIDVPANTSTVIDLSMLGHNQRINYVINFCSALYNYHKSFGFKRAPQEFVVFEEGHTYFNNGCFRSPRVFSPCVDVVTVGANFNLRFGVITQFPASLDKALVKVCQQRYFGWSTEANDLSYIKAFVGKEYTNPKNVDSVFNLAKGQFLYQLRNRIEKVQSSPYVQPQGNFTLNGQSVQFGFNL